MFRQAFLTQFKALLRQLARKEALHSLHEMLHRSQAPLLRSLRRMWQGQQDTTARLTLRNRLPTQSRSTASGPSVALQAQEATGKKWTWQRLMIASTGIVVGVPVVTTAGFVYNLKNDPEFLVYFDEKYPDLIDTIKEYVDVHDLGIGQQEEVEGGRASRHFGPVYMDAIVVMQSGKQFRLRLDSSAGSQKILEAAIERGADKSDSVVNVTFEDAAVASGDNTKVMAGDKVEKNLNLSPSNVDENVVSTWPKERPVRVTKKVSSESRMKWEISALKGKLSTLEAEKKTGYREIDDIALEIEQTNNQIKELEKHLPHKKYFYFF